MSSTFEFLDYLIFIVYALVILKIKISHEECFKFWTLVRLTMLRINIQVFWRSEFRHNINDVIESQTKNIFVTLRRWHNFTLDLKHGQAMIPYQLNFIWNQYGHIRQPQINIILWTIMPLFLLLSQTYRRWCQPIIQIITTENVVKLINKLFVNPSMTLI